MRQKTTRNHILWECPGNNLINHTHMQKSDHFVKLAHEYWDTDQVLFARGLLPRDWLPVTELAECAETRLWEGHHLAWPPFLCTLSAAHLSNYSAPGARQTDCSSGEPFKHLVASTKRPTSNSRLIAKYVTKGVTQRCELGIWPDGNLWSILFPLIDGRSGNADVIKVKSHLEDVGPPAIQQDKNDFSSHAGELCGGCRGRGGSETSAA